MTAQNKAHSDRMAQSRDRSLLSPFLFSLFLEFVLADLKSLCKEFKLDTNLSFDIRYANDTTIMSNVFEKLQLSTEELQAACRKWGMKINFSKCKVINARSSHH